MFHLICAVCRCAYRSQCENSGKWYACTGTHTPSMLHQQNKSISSKSHRVSLNNRKIKQNFLSFPFAITREAHSHLPYIEYTLHTHTHTYGRTGTSALIHIGCWRVFSLWCTLCAQKENEKRARCTILRRANVFLYRCECNAIADKEMLFSRKLIAKNVTIMHMQCYFLSMIWNRWKYGERCNEFPTV